MAGEDCGDTGEGGVKCVVNCRKEVAMVEFHNAYFIKLGRSGGWEKSCIDGGVLRLGYMNPHHNECLAGNYETLRQWFEEQGKTKGVVTSTVNQVKTFYEADESTLWITFFQRKLWWGFAEPGIQKLEDGSRTRRVRDGWKSTDENGEVLSVDKISGRLTKVQMYQGTICEIKESKYLRDKINGVIPEDVRKAKEYLSALTASVLPLIKNLTWKDFELLVDLLFTNAGWKRIGVLGKTEKDIDLDLMMPVNGRRAFVQVKSYSTQSVFEEYVSTFSDNDLYDEMYFVVHSLKSGLQIPQGERRVTVIDDTSLARLVINSGMIEWVIEKAT